MNLTGRAATDRGRRYLDQMIDHLDTLASRRHEPDQPAPGRHHQRHRHVAHGDPVGYSGVPEVLEISRSGPDAATVAFAIGTCEIRVEPDALTLTVDAAAEADLGRLMMLIAERLETIGRRDDLVLNWASTPKDGPR